MALLEDIIKKYEKESQQKIAEARALREAQKTEEQKFSQIEILNDQPSEKENSTVVFEDKLMQIYTLLSQVNALLSEIQTNSNILQELARLKKENSELKEKLNRYMLT
ncbi:MAG: hypothetical protein QW097_02015 [archaeon]